jgi:hypothetical protein
MKGCSPNSLFSFAQLDYLWYNRSGMENPDNFRTDIESTVHLLREHLEIIRINLEILGMLRQNDRIRSDDPEYGEILQLDAKHRKSFHDFILNRLPGLVAGEKKENREELAMTFRDWAEDLLISLRFLNRITGLYVRKLIGRDEDLYRSIDEKEVKDKRFWSFLEESRNQPHVFTSFVSTEEEEESKQSPDTEEHEGRQD